MGIGLIGAGAMDCQMARHLIAAGHVLHVFDTNTVALKVVTTLGERRRPSMGWAGDAAQATRLREVAPRLAGCGVPSSTERSCLFLRRPSLRRQSIGEGRQGGQRSSRNELGAETSVRRMKGTIDLLHDRGAAQRLVVLMPEQHPGPGFLSRMVS
jgi:hypothetical protein